LVCFNQAIEIKGIKDMKANKTITNMIKRVATNQKKTFILTYGVLRTVVVCWD
jgi:hypothetical protein